MNLPLHRSVQLSQKPWQRSSGYLLLEVVLALTLFSVAVLGLANSLQIGIEGANELNRENTVRMGMRSFLEEIRYKPTSEMSTSFQDQKLRITYTSVLDPVTLKNKDGTVLSDLYQLTITAVDAENATLIETPLKVFVYKTATSTTSSP